MSSTLVGRRILVTRAEEQAGELAERLRSLGAEPIMCAVIKSVDPLDWQPLDQALARLMQYDWVIFTSATGVRFLFERAAVVGSAINGLRELHIGAVGRGTAQALAARGVHVDFVPEEYVAEALVAGIGDVAGRRILLPRADIARKILVDGLVEKGAVVDDVVAYRTLPADPEGCSVPFDVDIATFTSASTVRNFITWLGKRPVREALPGASIACIGPITAQAAQEAGLSVDVVATEHTLDGLIHAITVFLEEHPS